HDQGDAEPRALHGPRLRDRGRGAGAGALHAQPRLLRGEPRLRREAAARLPAPGRPVNRRPEGGRPVARVPELPAPFLAPRHVELAAEIRARFSAPLAGIDDDFAAGKQNESAAARAVVAAFAGSRALHEVVLGDARSL